MLTVARDLTQISGRRVRLLLAAVVAALVCVGAAAPAGATVTFSSLSLSTTTTQAGASPDVTVNATFASPDGDTPKDATISLPAGLLANPSAVAPCPAQQFQADTCPPSSQIGDGSITGTTLGQTVPMPVAVYLLTPPGAELALIGVVVNFFDSPVASVTAPVDLRASPDVGLDIPITGIPDQIQGVGVQVNALQMTLFGSVNAHAFTRNPTSCATATSLVTITSYGAPSTPVSASASLTPTGCASLAFHPQLTDTATVDSGDNGVTFAASIAQGAPEAATKSVTMTLPSGLAPRLSALSTACTATDLTSCPPIGSATVTTPLLGSPLQGKLVLLAHSGALPTIDAVLPPPFAIILRGTPTLGAGGLTVTFSGIPDVPITQLVVAFSGGPSSLLVAGPNLCSRPGALTGDFIAQSGETAHDSAPLVAGNCSSSGGGGGTGRGGSGGATAKRPTTRPPTARLSFSGLPGRSAQLTLTVAAARNEPDLKVVKIQFPSGLSLEHSKLTRGVIIKLDGHNRVKTVRLVKKTLTVSLGGAGRVAVIVLKNPALVLTRALAKKIRELKVLRVNLIVTVIDAKGRNTRLRVSAATR